VPEFKIEKRVVERRVRQLAGEGVKFVFGADVGGNVDAAELRQRHDALVLATGSRVPRDLPVPGSELEGVHFAMEYLYERTRGLQGITAAGKHVVIGGVTRALTAGHVHREARRRSRRSSCSRAPGVPPDDLHAVAAWPMKLRTSRVEGRWGARRLTMRSRAGTAASSRSTGNRTRRAAVRPRPVDRGIASRRPGALAMGFLGPETPIPTPESPATRVETSMRPATTPVEGFAAGDARRGQSLIVCDQRGQECAAAVSAWLARFDGGGVPALLPLIAAAPGPVNIR
jgi:glutamate synthase (NADPH/NADH) small chain